MNNNDKQYIVDKKYQIIAFNGFGLLLLGALMLLALSKDYYYIGLLCPMVLLHLIITYVLTQQNLDHINRINWSSYNEKQKS